MSPPSSQTLLITGGTGFIGQHVVREALSKGYNLRATVRSDSSASKLKTSFPSAASSGQLTFATVPDITVSTAYESAFRSTVYPITGILHLASPVTFDATDNKKDLLDPALDGTRAILTAAQNYGKNVRRVVLTSSFAAILDLERGYRPGYTYTEDDWNDISYSTAAEADPTTAYCASKSLAEKAAWDFMATHSPPFDLSTIAPAWVFGPHVGGIAPGTDFKTLNESSATLAAKLLDQTEIPATDFAAYVDVRDVATAHVLAFEVKEAGGERFLVSEHFDYQSAVDVLREEMPELGDRIPVGEKGEGEREEVYGVDGGKAERVLGLRYRVLGECMRDALGELVGSERA